MEEKLKAFLKEHKAKLAFETNLKNLNKGGYKTIAKYCDRYPLKAGMQRAFTLAFLYIETPEGRDYWLDLDIKWREYIKQ